MHTVGVTKQLSKAWKQAKKEKDPNKEDYWVFLNALRTVFLKQYLVASFPWLLVEGASFLIPIIISKTVAFVADKDAPLLHGIGLVTLLPFLFLMMALMNIHGFFRVTVLYQKVTSGIMGIVYKKALRVSDVSRGNASNLLSIDPPNIAWNLYNLADLVCFMWLGIFSKLILLGSWLGISCFASILFLVLLIPINYFSSKVFSRTQKIILERKDQRIKVLNELLNGIMVIKLFSWEEKMKERVDEIRQLELEQIKKYSWLHAILNFTMATCTNGLPLATFGVYALLGNQPDASVIFPSLVIFSSITTPIVELPANVSHLIDGIESCKRIALYLNREEIKAPTSVLSTKELQIRIQNGTFQHIEKDQNIVTEREAQEKAEEEEAIQEVVRTPKQKKVPKTKDQEEQDDEWDFPQAQGEKSSFLLKDIDIHLQGTETVAVIGRVGAGKSSLLLSILGEMKRNEGVCHVNGRICYVPQSPWIRNMSIKENILFGNAFDEQRYNEVVKVSCLDADLLILQDGDQTEIGEKGINLSGGQKQRLSLARALYANADIYLLDDPLSAVDAHVGAKIFKKCIKRYLKKKLCVLVTHQLQYLNEVDRIFLMEKGRIQQQGTYKELLQNGYDFADILQNVLTRSNDSLSSSNPLGLSSSGTLSISTNSLMESAEIPNQEPEKEENKKPKVLIADEESKRGAVELEVYISYIQKVGYFFFGLLMAFQISIQALKGFQDIWLKLWSDATWPDQGIGFYLGIYSGIAVVHHILSLLKWFGWYKMCFTVGRTLHNEMLHAVLYAPFSYFNTTPSGRIINRFSKDIDQIDTILPEQFNAVLTTLFDLISIYLTIIILMPWMVIVAFVVSIFFYFIQKYYRVFGREISRLNSVSKSPIFSRFTETINGLSSIRAFGKEKQMQREIFGLIDTFNTVSFHGQSAVRWMQVRSELITAFSSLMLGFLLVFLRSSITPALAGLVLSLSSSVNRCLKMSVRVGTVFESNMVSVERVLQMGGIQNEGAMVSDKDLTNWPHEGSIEFKDVSMRYFDDQPEVLKKISFSIQPKQKIGVVGRTGAGKSSLTNVLFRLTEVCGGKVLIDKKNTKEIGLRELRQKLSIITQEPVLFSGTIRSNLDPFEEYPDTKIFEVLEKIHMSQFIKDQSDGIDTAVGDNGCTLSLGQRQLLCIGRALLCNNKILVMDEATASVDTETDGLIQQTIKREFEDRTVITIAHRLETIMDSDLIFVMDQGNLKETGSPRDLLQDKQSMFSQLVERTGQHAKKLRAMVNL